MNVHLHCIRIPNTRMTVCKKNPQGVNTTCRLSFIYVLPVLSNLYYSSELQFWIGSDTNPCCTLPTTHKKIHSRMAYSVFGFY